MVLSLHRRERISAGSADVAQSMRNTSMVCITCASPAHQLRRGVPTAQRLSSGCGFSGCECPGTGLAFIRVSPRPEPIMKTLIVAIAAALVSAAASVGSVGTFTGVANEREVAVDMPVDVNAVDALVPFIEKAARDQGLTRIRAYKTSVFIPLEQAQLSFVLEDGHLKMHVAVESEYRFQKGQRLQALEGLKVQGNTIFAQALMLQGAAAH
jgi:hypothetical protein